MASSDRRAPPVLLWVLPIEHSRRVGIEEIHAVNAVFNALRYMIRAPVTLAISGTARPSARHQARRTLALSGGYPCSIFAAPTISELPMLLRVARRRSSVPAAFYPARVPAWSSDSGRDPCGVKFIVVRPFQTGTPAYSPALPQCVDQNRDMPPMPSYIRPADEQYLHGLFMADLRAVWAEISHRAPPSKAATSNAHRVCVEFFQKSARCFCRSVCFSHPAFCGFRAQ